MSLSHPLYMLYLCPLITLLMMGMAQAAKPDPVHLAERTKGENCGNPSSEEITYRSLATEPISLSLCIQRADDISWQCTKNSSLKTGKTLSKLSCSGIIDHRYWWAPENVKTYRPSFDEPSGRYWTSYVKCKNDKVYIRTEEPVPVLLKVEASNGRKVAYRKFKRRDKSGEIIYIVNQKELIGFICGPDNVKETGWFHSIRGQMRKKIINQCVQRGGDEKECRKTGESVSSGERG